MTGRPAEFRELRVESINVIGQKGTFLKAIDQGVEFLWSDTI